MRLREHKKSTDLDKRFIYSAVNNQYFIRQIYNSNVIKSKLQNLIDKFEL